jgi:hypothetical protein
MQDYLYLFHQLSMHLRLLWEANTILYMTSIEPGFGSKLFGSSGREHGHVTGAITESDTDPRLQNVGLGRIQTGLLRQPDRKFEVDGHEAATDVEVGTVDNESPRLEGAKDWIPFSSQ